MKLRSQRENAAVFSPEHVSLRTERDPSVLVACERSSVVAWTSLCALCADGNPNGGGFACARAVVALMSYWTWVHEKFCAQRGFHVCSGSSCATRNWTSFSLCWSTHPSIAVLVLRRESVSACCEHSTRACGTMCGCRGLCSTAGDWVQRKTSLCMSATQVVVCNSIVLGVCCWDNMCIYMYDMYICVYLHTCVDMYLKFICKELEDFRYTVAGYLSGVLILLFASGLGCRFRAPPWWRAPVCSKQFCTGAKLVDITSVPPGVSAKLLRGNPCLDELKRSQGVVLERRQAKTIANLQASGWQALFAQHCWQQRMDLGPLGSLFCHVHIGSPCSVLYVYVYIPRS